MEIKAMNDHLENVGFLLDFLENNNKTEMDILYFELPRQVYTRSDYFSTPDDIGFHS